MTNGNKEIGDQRKPAVVPASNICEMNGKIVVRLEMPGVKKNDIDINVNNNELRITGKRADESGGGKYIVRERATGDYSRVYTIDETVDRERIDAAMEDGVLTLTLELKENEKPRKIEVKAS